MICIQCEQRPVWRPYTHYVCRECYEHLMEARAQCPCPCHPANQYPAMCCTERHLVTCNSFPPENGSTLQRYDGEACGNGS